VRRALGFKLERTEYELRRFVGWLDVRELDTITAKNALSWATRSSRATASHPNGCGWSTGSLHTCGQSVCPSRSRRATCCRIAGGGRSRFLYTNAEITALSTHLGHSGVTAVINLRVRGQPRSVLRRLIGGRAVAMNAAVTILHGAISSGAVTSWPELLPIDREQS
jgi:hypothetical protein